MVRKLIAILLTLLILFSSISVVTSGQKNQDDENSGLRDSPWPIEQHDVRRTGKSPYGKDGCTALLKWRIELSGAPSSISPVIDKDGTIYIVTSENLYAISPDGTIKWKTKVGNTFCSALAIGRDGTIYTGMWNGKLYAISPDGEKKWEVRIGPGGVARSLNIDKDGIIYVGTAELWGVAKFAAVYPNGTIKWRINVSDEWGQGFSAPAIYDDTIYVEVWVYYGEKTYLYAIYKNNGTVKWKRKLGWSGTLPNGPSIAEDGTIYAYAGSTLFAYYPNGTLKWKKNLERSISESPVMGNDGTIYVGGFNICALDPDGNVLWKKECPYYSHGVIIDKNDVIYGTGTYGLFAFSPNGTLKWIYKVNEDLDGSPAIGEDGTIYFVGWHYTSHDMTTYLYAIEPRDAADLRITGVYYGPTFRCIKIKVKNAGCEPAYNATCEAIVQVPLRFRSKSETIVFTTTVPFIDVGEEKVVKIKDVYLSPFLYRSPLVDLYWESILKEIRVEGENINPDIYLEGNRCDLITVWGPFVFVGSFLGWLVFGSRWVEVTS